MIKQQKISRPIAKFRIYPYKHASLYPAMLHDQNDLNRLGKTRLHGKANCISLVS